MAYPARRSELVHPRTKKAAPGLCLGRLLSNLQKLCEPILLLRIQRLPDPLLQILQMILAYLIRLT
jgi:hypothetical protein